MPAGPLSILIADGAFDGGPLDGLLVLGELGLDGSIRRVHGTLASTMLARANLKKVMSISTNSRHANLGIAVRKRRAELVAAGKWALATIILRGLHD